MMSRIPIKSFLVKAKDHLRTYLQDGCKGRQINFVIGNESADLDSITCALVYGYIRSTAKPDTLKDLIIPVTNIPTSDLHLRTELTALLRHADLKPSDLITLDDLGGLPTQSETGQQSVPDRTNWTLVDHNVLQGVLGRKFAQAVTGVIDHHDDEQKVPANAEPRIIEKTGSCASHVVNYLSDKYWDLSPASNTSGPSISETTASSWDVHATKLALGAILIDTINMTAEHKITAHDRRAVTYLEKKLQSANESYTRDAFFTEINDAKSNIDSLLLEDILRKDYKQWTDAGLTLGIASVVQGIDYLLAREHAAEVKSEKLIDACREFMAARELDLLAIMTAFTAQPSGEFSREILLMTREDGEPRKAAQRFYEQTQAELQLHQTKHDFSQERLPYLQVWDQRNLEASRKRVAPLMRAAMRGDEANGTGKL